MVYNSEGQNVITEENEVNVIAYEIQNSDDILLGKTNDGNWIVKTTDGIMIYSTKEMEERYFLDLVCSNIERLTYTS